MKNRIVVLLLFTCAFVAGTSIAGGPNGSRKPLASYQVQVDAGWNLLSVPLDVADGTKGVLYPTATSPAYTYLDSYVAIETLETGPGYWLKFASPQTIIIDGDTTSDKAIPVHAGWNMIGSHSVPILVNTVQSDPPGIITSKFYRYAAAGGYQEADTIQPGRGYWVKVNGDGIVFLTAPYTSSSTIGDSMRTIILDSVNAFVNRLPHADENADNQSLVQYLHGIPQFEAADTALGGVWGRFTDGRMYVRVNNRAVSGNVPEKPTGHIPESGGEHLLSPTDNLPTSSTAWICNALGSYFESPPGDGVSDVIHDLKQWHTLTGYTLASNSGATVGRLKNVSNVGVFYISAHGGFCEDRSNNNVYAVWTATVDGFLFDLIFKRDLDDGSLVYMTAPNISDGSGGGIEETHYAITTKFVQKYMNFKKDGLVYIDACWSHYNRDFAVACLGKGAGFYVGWTLPVGNSQAVRAARHFHDRMLGTNKYFPETPPQRPFDADLVWNDLILKGYDSSPSSSGVSKFQIDPVIPRANLLAPSILQGYPSFIPGESNFYIDGLFGQDPRPDIAVKVGGATLNITNWDSTKITLDQPLHGGDVEVTIRGRKSNVTQYTQWHAVFDYTLLGRGSLRKHITMNVDFLADVHNFRINIANPPIFGPGPRFIQVLKSSHATYECSGEYRDPLDTAAVVEYWNGSGDVPIGTDFTFSSTISDAGNPFPMYLGFSAEFDNTGSPETLGIDFGLDNITTTMNSDYSFATGSKSGGDETNTAEITWGAITPTYPPNPNGAR